MRVYILFLFAMMSTRLLLLLYLTGHVFAKKSQDVDCLVVNLDYVSCKWNKTGTPEVNYTFYSKLGNDQWKICNHYLTENNVNIGCNQQVDSRDRFKTFRTRLTNGSENFEKGHELKKQVKLNPPTNLTVLNGSDFNLWFYWNHTSPAPLHCVEGEVRFRTNNNNWDFSKVSAGIQKYCINLPSSSSRYELQVRNRIDDSCGESIFWSDWSEPVVWGSNNSTYSKDLMSPWTPVIYVVGAISFILLAMLLLHHERLRIILVPVVPKPSPFLHNIEDWFQFSKGLKDNFKPDYNERACPVREYNYVSQSDVVSSDGSTCSVTTDQTNCSIEHDPEDLSAPFPSNPVSSEEVQKASV
ncbi:cytokine receptor common subunit gamma-like [Pundamilia nyererei]|uniref:Cytokine receptor common subunit gamma-like n=1 Tax=Pundamilia nyererei TaxID=303518 RepID=A0A3B4GGN8_9CICH|nr:PREDICTED: cytokine receptor common subunit gamma-like [Pundamilia nyererei]